MTTLNRYLCFNLGAEEFAIPLLAVKEVIGVPEVTPVPQTPSYFLGIMNLRGSVISVMDLRLKMGIKAQRTEETTVVILDLGNYQLGVMVDRVNSVLSIGDDNFSEPPRVEASKMAEAISGIYRKENSLILILDIAKALSIEDQSVLIKKQNVA